MDEYLFRHFVDECREVEEATSYVEILNYSDPAYNTFEQHPLTLDEFENFLNRRGAFAPPENLPRGVKLTSALRLVTQINAKHPDTFTPYFLSLPKPLYKSLVHTFALSLKSIETTAAVGPFFYAALNNDPRDPRLQIIHRKSDVRKKGKTRGWEMMLSHAFGSGVTTGFLKGTPSSDVVKVLDHVKESKGQIAHPMLLPLMFLSHDLSPANDQKQRDARDWVRRLENAVSMRDEVETSEMYFQDDLLEIDGLSRDLVECHGHVMWKRPQAYTALCKEMEGAMELFKRRWGMLAPDEERLSRDEKEMRREVERLHGDMCARIGFYEAKLKGLENYIHTTLQRLKVQREGLYNIFSQREARLNLEIAGEQRRIAHASKRDSTAMKTLSLLGALFLPGTYLASVFGMSFFNFESSAEPVSVELWIYFAVTVPITAIIVVTWIAVDRKRERQHAKDDADLERNIDKMERDIMRHMRKRTMSKAHTWKSTTAPPKEG